MGKIIFGVLFIIAGLSGRFVLIGTQSGMALIVIGVVWIIWGIARLSSSRSR